MQAMRTTLSRDADRRVQWGLGVQPFVAGALAAALFPLLDYSHPGRTTDPVGQALALGLYVGIAAAIITGCAAYPAFLWLLRRGRVTRTHALLTGVALGNIPAAMALVPLVWSAVSQTGALPNPAQLATDLVRAVAFGSAIGGVSAAVFWWIAGASLRSEHPRPVP